MPTRAEFLKTLPLFAELTPAELETLARDQHRQQYQPGEVICYQGDPGLVMYLVESGQVRIVVHSEAGQETSVNLCGPGDIFGELAVIDGLPRSASALAMGPTTLFALSRDHFLEHLRRAPQLGLNFMRLLSVRVRYSTVQMDNLTTLTVPRRLARKLLELAKQHGVPEPGGVRLRVTLTQTELASLIGATRESLNKALGQLRKRGLIQHEEGRIIIIDPEALRDASL